MGELMHVAPDALPGPLPTAFARAMSTLPTLWGRLMLDPEFQRKKLEQAVAEAEALPAALIEEIKEQGGVATPNERSSFLRMLVSAWPNASQNDLAGYSLQLAQDVEEQRPSRYALVEAAKHLRRTSRFLPSICEVLEAITAAEKPIRNTLTTLERIPVELERAKVKLAKPVRVFGQPLPRKPTDADF